MKDMVSPKLHPSQIFVAQVNNDVAVSACLSWKFMNELLMKTKTICQRMKMV